MNVVQVLWPELILIIVGCALILLGVSARAAARRAAPAIALITLAALFALQWIPTDDAHTQVGAGHAVRLYQFAFYIKLLASAIGFLLVLLAWPTNREATGNPALEVGTETGEFFGLMLLSIAGIFLVAGANDLMLLFLGIELASIPTYIMVSISRPLPAAREAGVKYFFLGALSAALLAFGFAYLYGITGTTDMRIIAASFADGTLSNWQKLAFAMAFGAFAFKMAAVPFHFYVGDVYQGAATPVTAFLAFVPKTSGIVALIKVLWMTGGNSWNVSTTLVTLLWVVAVLTMTFGNVLALLQGNVKRVLAYSSVAHSGYMLAGLTALISSSFPLAQNQALQGVMFYLAAYGLMNTAAFAVLTLLPARPQALTASGPAQPIHPGTSAETYEDLAGQGRQHIGLGLAMAVACFSLIGIPLTVGFFGKFFLIKPMWTASAEPMIRQSMVWLVVLTVLNAAISAGYYLRIVATLFLRTEVEPAGEPPAASEAGTETRLPLPIFTCLLLCVIGTLMFGILTPATDLLGSRAHIAVQIEGAAPPVQASVDRE